jgi:hypothetical protein
MARYPVVNTGTLDVTLPKTTDVLDAIKVLEEAETDFYNLRRDLINGYPGKIKDITAAEVEKIYDSKIGTEPWRYTEIYNDSGSVAKSNDYPSPSVITSYGFGSVNELAESTANCFWIDMGWENTPQSTPSGGYPYIHTDEVEDPDTFVMSDVPTLFRFLSVRGAAWIDLAAGEDGGAYNSLFSSRGTKKVHQDSTLLGVLYGGWDGKTDYYEGFGISPVAHEGKGGLSDWQAHMCKLVGKAWDDSVGGALQDYKDRLKEYQDDTKAAASIVLNTTSIKGPWDGYTQTAALSMNKPGVLKASLVQELRGIN